MKKVLLSITALSMLALASCEEGEKKEDSKETEHKEVKKDATDVEPKAEAMTLGVDLEESHVYWHSWDSKAPEDHAHMGKLRMTSGTIEVTDGELTGGKAVINLASMFDSDLEENQEKKGGLIGHLMSPEFFNIDSTGVGAPMIVVNGYKDGMIMGDLTINGKTNAVEIPAMVTVTEDMVDIKSEKFMLDMTPYAMPFFAQEKEGEKALILNSEIEFSIALHAHK